MAFNLKKLQLFHRIILVRDPACVIQTLDRALHQVNHACNSRVEQTRVYKQVEH